MADQLDAKDFLFKKIMDISEDGIGFLVDLVPNEFKDRLTDDLDEMMAMKVIRKEDGCLEITICLNENPIVRVKSDMERLVDILEDLNVAPKRFKTCKSKKKGPGFVAKKPRVRFSRKKIKAPPKQRIEEFPTIDQLAAYVARQKAIRFIQTFYKWEEASRAFPALFKGQHLVGGRAGGQEYQKGQNPIVFGQPSEAAHLVQVDSTVPWRELPPDLQAHFGDTIFVPKAWNRAIDRIVDKVQEIYIKKYNDGLKPNWDFFQSYIKDVIKDLKIAYNATDKNTFWNQITANVIEAQLQTLEKMMKNETEFNDNVDGA